MEPPQLYDKSRPAIASRLKHMLVVENIKAAEFCRRTGVAPNTFTQWINMPQRPDLDLAIQVCEAFEVSLDWIYRGIPKGLPGKYLDRLFNQSQAPPSRKSGGPPQKTAGRRRSA